MATSNVTSTKVRANAEVVNEILQLYTLIDCKIVIDDEGCLQIVGVGENTLLDGWPLAVSAGEMPKRDEDSDEEEYLDDLKEFLDDEGWVGFESLLLDLATCIESPLMVLAVNADDDSHWSTAQVWRIEPGSEEVECLNESAYSWG